MKRAPINVQLHGLQQIALRDRGNGAGHFSRRPKKVFDQCVDRRLHVSPGSTLPVEARALPGRSLFADDRSNAFELFGHPLVGGNNIVEGVGGLTRETRPIQRQPYGKITIPHRLQRAKQFANVEGISRILREICALSNRTAPINFHQSAPNLLNRFSRPLNAPVRY